MLAFRDLLLRHPTLEAAYLALVRARRGHTAAAVRQPARSRDPAQCARRLRGSVRAARGRAVFPAAAHHAARPVAACRRRGSRSAARASTPVSSLVSMLGMTDGGARSTCSAMRTPIITGSAATSSTWRSISPPARRGPAALAKPWRAGFPICSGSMSTIEPLTELRDAKLTWYVGLDSEATGIGDRLLAW